jgi:hypothetical protein
MSNELAYHTASPEHRPFVVGTWMKAMRRAPEFVYMSDDTYYNWARKHVSFYVEQNPTLVALDPEDLDIVIGFLNYTDTTCNFTYIRKDFRGNGIYKRLKELSGITRYSHRSDRWSHQRGRLEYAPWFL